MTKFSHITWEGADSQVRRLAGVSRQEPPEEHFRSMANILLMYIWRILDGKHDWAYRKSLNLTMKADADFLEKASITALNVDPAVGTNYITASGYEFRTGAWVTMQGVSTTEGEIAGFRGLVVQGGYTALLESIVINGVNQGYFPTLADYGNGAGVAVVNSLGKNVADLSSISLKKIVGVYDVPAGGSQRVWELVKDYATFRTLTHDRAYDDQVACYQRGDILEVYTGPDATAIANPVCEYDGIPEQYTVATKGNHIQLFEEYYNMWFDLMLGWTLDAAKKPKDPVLEARIDQHLETLNNALREA